MSDQHRRSANEQAPDAAATDRLLAGPVRVVNIGLDQFAADLVRNGAAVVDIEWSPPAQGDTAMAALLAKLGV